MATTSKPGPQPVEKPLISPQAIAGASVHIEDSEIEYTEDTKKARNVQVQLQYLASDPLYKTTKPVQVTPNFFDPEHRTNVKLAPGQPETLNDVRGRFEDFTLDDNGFQYVHAPTTFSEWSSQPRIGEVYLKELETLLRNEVDGCDEILFYDARIRQAGDEGVRVEGLSYNPFARQVHVDNTARSIVEKIKSMTEMKADYLLQGRARVINIWRPIKHPVYDCGLCIADGGKLTEADVMECDRVRQDTGKYWDTMGVIQYRPGYDWYYMSEHDPDAVLLFKNYDSATNVKARLCLHSAFDMPAHLIPKDAPTRESIEVRALVFTHPRGRRFSEGTLRNSAIAIEHPLAVSLQKGDLKRLDDEHSIVDRIRKDIDEAGEVKDAELLIRKRRIRELERNCESLIAERDQERAELNAVQDQLRIQQGHNEALSDKVALLERGARPHSELQQENKHLSKQLTQAYLALRNQPKIEHDGLLQLPPSSEADPEKYILLQQLERAQQEAQMWKNEAHGVAGNRAVSACWQASVDEAVRREREKDAFVIKALRDEISSLRGR